MATYTRLETPSLEPAATVRRRPAVAGEPRRSRWETVLASGFVDERRRSAAPDDGVRRTRSRQAASGCVAHRVHGS